MNKKFRYIAYVLTGIALLTVIFFTKDEIKALASNKVYLNESDLTLELGRYRTLKVYGSKERVTYKSANNRAATVSSNGRVTAQGWGTTRVYAYVGNRTLSTKVTIVQMNNKNVTLAPGNTSKLTLWGANNTTSWKSSNNKVATVSDDGLVTAVSNGSATITATFKGKKITSNITVVGISDDSFVLEYNGRFSATSMTHGGRFLKLYITGTKDKVTWSSSNTKVATVDSKGKVIAQGPGTAKITATINGSKISSNVKVLQMQDNLVELSVNKTFSPKVLGTNSKITWMSYNESVATVSEDGIVTTKNPGTTKIVADVDGRLVRCIVIVK